MRSRCSDNGAFQCWKIAKAMRLSIPFKNDRCGHVAKFSWNIERIQVMFQELSRQLFLSYAGNQQRWCTIAQYVISIKEPGQAVQHALTDVYSATIARFMTFVWGSVLFRSIVYLGICLEVSSQQLTTGAIHSNHREVDFVSPEFVLSRKQGRWRSPLYQPRDHMCMYEHARRPRWCYSRSRRSSALVNDVDWSWAPKRWHLCKCGKVLFYPERFLQHQILALPILPVSPESNDKDE
jgi:hypothetical protein